VLVEKFSELVSDFIEASRNFVFNFLHKRQQNIVEIISTHTANFETHLLYILGSLFTLQPSPTFLANP
jgi:hypothetical protein